MTDSDRQLTNREAPKDASRHVGGAVIELPRLTADQEAYLNGIAATVGNYDATLVIGGACKYEQSQS